MAVDDRRRASRRLQVSAWRGDQQTVVISPCPDRPPPTGTEVEVLVARLSSTGARRAITGALHHNELDPFLNNGFEVHERLHLLRHDLTDNIDRPALSFRRARRRDRDAVLALDAAAFDDFWGLDHRGLDDAIRATPVSRFRIHRGRPGSAGAATIDAYAVTGRAGGRGYLQRLAVHPDHRRAGLGCALVTDSLRWLQRGGARVALVNTQEANEAALGLYLRCGFELEPHGLTVLVRPLASDLDSP